MKLDELKALAEKATPGPWRLSPPEADEVQMWHVCEPNEEAYGTIADFYNYSDAQDEVNARYVHALSPERVLAMIACIEAADAMVDKWFAPDFAAKEYAKAYDAARAALEQSK